MESMVQKELDDMELENSKLKEELLKKTEEIVQLRSADLSCNERGIFGSVKFQSLSPTKNDQLIV